MSPATTTTCSIAQEGRRLRVAGKSKSVFDLGSRRSAAPRRCGLGRSDAAAVVALIAPVALVACGDDEPPPGALRPMRESARGQGARPRRVVRDLRSVLRAVRSVAEHRLFRRSVRRGRARRTGRAQVRGRRVLDVSGAEPRSSQAARRAAGRAEHQPSCRSGCDVAVDAAAEGVRGAASRPSRAARDRRPGASATGLHDAHRIRRAVPDEHEKGRSSERWSRWCTTLS
jgi:hypothetical protein